MIYIYIYISGPSCQKVILPLLWKSALTKAEAAARHSTQQPVKLIVGRYLNK